MPIFKREILALSDSLLSTTLSKAFEINISASLLSESPVYLLTDNDKTNLKQMNLNIII